METAHRLRLLPDRGSSLVHPAQGPLAPFTPGPPPGGARSVSQ
ncbi:hypothetical protein ABZ951_13425 [Streptomyces sp. NPDC046215]|uniref:Uncharacterized protein n=1 Tax=Streptomyces stramineus TaxID=173861 RepID=A0ABP3JVJ7_9ACTN